MSDQKPIANQPGDEQPSQAEISQPDSWAQVQLAPIPARAAAQRRYPHWRRAIFSQTAFA